MLDYINAALVSSCKVNEYYKINAFKSFKHYLDIFQYYFEKKHPIATLAIGMENKKGGGDEVVKKFGCEINIFREI